MKRVIKQTNIYGMSRVGYSNGYEVYVNTDDPGNIPHFHYRDKDDWSKFHSCIRIDKADYFQHEGKEDTLNAHQRKDLQEFMESPVDDIKYGKSFKNNWELVCFLWNINNSTKRIDDNIKMPNYRLL